MEKQERGFVNWLNFILTPAEEYQSNDVKVKGNKFLSYYMGLVARKPVFGVSDKRVSNQSPHLQGLYRKLKIHL